MKLSGYKAFCVNFFTSRFHINV